MTSRAFAFIVSGALITVLGSCSSDSKSSNDASGGTGGTSGGNDGGGTGGTAGTGGGGGSGGSVMDAAMAADTNKPADTATAGDTAGGTSMSFFITSRTGDGNLGGLTGADKICQDLAAAVGAGGKTWHAYLSTNNPKVHAKDRVGSGPWYNVKGVKIAEDLAALHTTVAMGAAPGVHIGEANGLTEKAEKVPLQNPNQHDILTGTNLDGTAFDGQTCGDWTGTGTARVGHYNQTGGGDNPPSWNAAHENGGCTAALITNKGGAGRFYCFAIN